MEVALFWHASGLKRIPRATSVHAASLGPQFRPGGCGSRSACALPLRAPGGLPAWGWIGRGVDKWADHHARYVLNPRGQRLFVQEWRPHAGDAKPRACVYVVHGLNDHSGKYTRVAKQLVEAGYAVVAHDAHGHGRSDGVRAHARSVTDYVDDAEVAIRDSERRLPAKLRRLPKFIVGHSLGGAVAIHLARERSIRNLKGVVLSAPAVKVYPHPVLRALAPILATVFPFMPVQKLKFDRRRKRKGDGDEARDPLVVKSPVRARIGYEVLKSCEKIMSTAANFRTPLYVAHSVGDRVTNSRGSVEFMKSVGSRDKTLKIYEGRAHDLLLARKKGTMSDIIAWLDRRAKGQR